ncbi:hypothetical protein DPMN_003561 [Dreissena polymorpha]|uniref:Uncharacterized protein n=1 Tax=Dreissena polymorpha TaxID=45954 RepID=A0A9D4MP43_DREPO|nr:hypothetical protein DPMN_003561 [Dreissena polymorpha]
MTNTPEYICLLTDLGQCLAVSLRPSHVAKAAITAAVKLRVAQNHPVPCDENLLRDCDLALGLT